MNPEVKTAARTLDVFEAFRLAAKPLTLSELARAGLVKSSTGPGGGFTLARAPERITVGEVMALFERSDAETRCPFGGGRCGVDQPCPLHDAFLRAQSAMLRFYDETTFGVFRGRDGASG